MSEPGLPLAGGWLTRLRQRVCTATPMRLASGANAHRWRFAALAAARPKWPRMMAQRRLPPEAPAQALALLQFGRLIGNSDMHFGNLSLQVASPADVARGRFTLAPVYDMLPMRWKPDAATGALDLQPFSPEPGDLASAARPVALRFWQQAAELAALSTGFRQLAGMMALKLRPIR